MSRLRRAWAALMGRDVEPGMVYVEGRAVGRLFAFSVNAQHGGPSVMMEVEPVNGGIAALDAAWGPWEEGP